MIHFLYFTAIVLLFAGCQAAGDSASPATSNNTTSTQGKAGSMARFGITGNTLYALSGETVKLFDISAGPTPSTSSTVLLGSGVETIFPYSGKLFFGTQAGMMIYDNTDPFIPKYLSRYDHIASCDPVVVSGNYAYVTLRAGTNCRHGLNELDIVDLSDIMNPKLAISYPMTNPKGLGIDTHSLFLCDGVAGLKIFDITDPLTLVVKGDYTTDNAYDVIPSGTTALLSNTKTLVMTGDSGICQYDYSDINNVKKISEIRVSP